MKNLFLLLLILNFSANAQDFTEFELPINDDGIVTFSDVVKIPGATTESLYSSGREWFVTTFKSADDVLQMDDRTAGKLIGKAYSEIPVGSGISATTTRLYYTVKLYFKEGRYKYEFTDLYYLAYANQYNTNPQNTPVESIIIDYLKKKNGKVRTLNAQYKTETVKTMKRMIENIRMAIAKETAADDDDW